MGKLIYKTDAGYRATCEKDPAGLFWNLHLERPNGREPLVVNGIAGSEDRGLAYMMASALQMLPELDQEVPDYQYHGLRRVVDRIHAAETCDDVLAISPFSDAEGCRGA